MASRIGYSARISNLEKKARGAMEGWLNVKKEKSGKRHATGDQDCVSTIQRLAGRLIHGLDQSWANRYFQNVPAERSLRLVNKYEYLEPAAIPDFGVRGYIFK
ncbi:uncharacterized protein MCYG_01457 [Microsporum canis CBS 113480]|uniref:Uncharacterized protein n=1 Tax=Arthroderma otae (strain ATCC MYA-4605 / CBS 113480) TaxID=554155 RepID=C5FH08_ARTOC|nr:uncharacterized protein MCYG_01457 [Microsporum canis CBS 113480]EEQ28638.1 predicted protein [Microsporum canis CBS 113480]